MTYTQYDIKYHYCSGEAIDFSDANMFYTARSMDQEDFQEWLHWLKFKKRPYCVAEATLRPEGYNRRDLIARKHFFAILVQA